MQLALPVILLLNGRRWQRSVWLIVGFGLMLLPWVVVVMAHWQDFRGQSRLSAERFDVFARIPHRSFPGGMVLRRPAQILGMLYYSLRDKL